MLVLTIAVSIGLVLWSLRRLKVELYGPEWLAMGITGGLLGGSWLVMVLALLMPYRLAAPLSLFMVVLALAYCHRLKIRPEPLKPILNILPGWWLITVAATLGFGILFYSHMLPAETGGWYTAGPTWGDIAVHLSFISHFSFQGQLRLDFPLFPDTKLSYPFLIDYLSSLLYRSGFSMQLSLLVPGLLLMLSFVQLFFFMVLRLTRSVAASALSLGLFFFNGSSAGLMAVYLAWQESGQSLLAFLQAMPKDYIYDTASGLHVYNVVFSSLLPQRGTLFGFSVFCLVVILLLQAKNRTRDYKFGIAIGAFAGLMPFAHTHTFLILGLLIGTFALYQWHKERAIITTGSIALGIMVLLAAPQMLWQLFAINSQGFVQAHSWWLMESGESPLLFWWRNIGLMLPVILAAPFVFAIFRKRFLAWLSGLGLLLFVLVNTVQMQPNLYDNSKFLVYVLLLGSVSLAACLAWAIRRYPAYAAAPVFLIVAMLTLPGAVSYFYEGNQHYQFLSNDDLAFAAAIRDKTLPTDRILTADTHNHPISTLSGRPIVMGYRGWLWTYGIDYAPVERDVKEMYAGSGETPELLRKYDVKYVVVGPQELREWGANDTYFDDHYPLVHQEGGWRMYKVN